MRIHLLLYSISRGLPRHGQRISRTGDAACVAVYPIHSGDTSFV